MRTVAGILVSAVVGVILAVAASFAIVLANGPDREAEAVLKKDDYKPAEVVQYGQR